MVESFPICNREGFSILTFKFNVIKPRPRSQAGGFRNVKPGIMEDMDGKINKYLKKFSFASRKNGKNRTK